MVLVIWWHGDLVVYVVVRQWQCLGEQGEGCQRDWPKYQFLAAAAPHYVEFSVDVG